MEAKSSGWVRSRMLKLRYSPLRIRPSSQVTREATVSPPWKWEMSKPSIRGGGIFLDPAETALVGQLGVVHGERHPLGLGTSRGHADVDLLPLLVAQPL